MAKIVCEACQRPIRSKERRVRCTKSSCKAHLHRSCARYSKIPSRMMNESDTSTYPFCPKHHRVMRKQVIETNRELGLLPRKKENKYPPWLKGLPKLFDD